MTTKNIALMICVPLMVIGSSASGTTTTLDLNSLDHGEIVNTQFTGVTISAENVGGGPDLAIIFDSRETSTRDPDLEGPPNRSWALGNFDQYPDFDEDTVLGNMLIIAENNEDVNGDDILDRPDDEGSRPAGTITFEFDTSISSFGFDLIDVEGPEEFGTSVSDAGFFATFYSGSETQSVGFGDLIARDAAQFGNNSANRIAPFTAAELGLAPAEFDRIDISLGGSAGITGINYTTVPTPSALLLGALGMAWTRWTRKRRVL